MKLWEKNGKLIENTEGKPIECDSCPCVPPAGCCPYPASGYGIEGGFAYADFPYAINAIYDSGSAPPGLELLKSASIPSLPGDGYYRGEGDLFGGEWAFIVEGGIWKFYVYNGGASVWELSASQPCLIENDGAVKSFDQFQDTYTGKYGDAEETPLNRIDLCTWEGEQELEGAMWRYVMRYNSVLFKFEIQISRDGEVIVTPQKDDPQSSPEGSYEGIFDVTP